MSSSEITGLIKNLGFALESALFWARFAICCGNRLLAPASGALQGGNPPEPGRPTRNCCQRHGDICGNSCRIEMLRFRMQGAGEAVCS